MEIMDYWTGLWAPCANATVTLVLVATRPMEVEVEEDAKEEEENCLLHDVVHLDGDHPALGLACQGPSQPGHLIGNHETRGN